MSTDRPDDFDEIPSLRPLPPADADDPDYDRRRDDRDDWRPVPRKPGYGFWMSVVWCLLFFAVTQVVIGMFCGVPIILAAAMVEAANQKGPPPEDPNALLSSDPVLIGMMLSTMCAHLGGIVFACLMLRWLVGRQWKRQIALSRPPSITHCLLVLVGLVAMLALGTAISIPIDKFVPSMEDLLRWVGIKLPMKGANEMIPEMVKASPLLLAVFTVGVLPAFDEELWCRGFIAHGLSRRYPAWAVVLMTSFLFGCLHVDPPQAIGAMFLGVVMHAAYVTTRSLWVPMALHFCNNSLGVIHFYFQGRPLAVLQPFEDGLTRSPALFVAASVLLFAAVAYALYQTRCKLVSVDPAVPAWQPPAVSGVDLPPPDSGTAVAHDQLSLVSVVLVLAGSLAFGLVLALV
jgi:membrane protease YdiL (CAAX protease family)